MIPVHTVGDRRDVPLVSTTNAHIAAIQSARTPALTRWARFWEDIGGVLFWLGVGLIFALAGML